MKYGEGLRKRGEGEVGFEMVTKNQLKKTFALIPSEWKEGNFERS